MNSSALIALPKRGLFKVLMLTSVILFLVAGCGGPTYKTEYYTLVADENASLKVEQPYTTSLGVGPVRLPEILNHSGIVSEGKAQQILIAPYAVWAGDLKVAVTRVLADNLSTSLGSDQILPFPWDNRIRPEQQIVIVFEHFSGERGGDVFLRAKWRLLSSNGDELLHSGKVNLQTEADGNSYNAYVVALNQLLNQLAEEIALAMTDQ